MCVCVSDLDLMVRLIFAREGSICVCVCVCVCMSVSVSVCVSLSVCVCVRGGVGEIGLILI